MQIDLPEPAALQEEFGRRGVVALRGVLGDRDVCQLMHLAEELIRRYEIAVNRDDDRNRLWYGVVTGDRVSTEGQRLFEFYTSTAMVEWVRQLTGASSVAPSEHLRSAININCLAEAGQRYRWHRDAVPYTALLFLTSLQASDGGEFLIRPADGGLLRIRPAAGDLVLMDGTRCPHAVAPLRRRALRITVPMVYVDRAAARPAGLDEYLYRGAARTG